MEDKIIEVQVTVGSFREAKLISDTLVSEKLAACANMHEVSSVYFWKGKPEKHSEWYILLKTSDGHFTGIERRVRQLCSYEVPAVIGVRVESVNEPYKKWVLENVK